MSHSGTVRGLASGGGVVPAASVAARGDLGLRVPHWWSSRELAIASIAGDRFEPGKAAAVIISMFCIPGVMLALRRPRPQRWPWPAARAAPPQCARLPERRRAAPARERRGASSTAFGPVTSITSRALRIAATSPDLIARSRSALAVSRSSTASASAASASAEVLPSRLGNYGPGDRNHHVIQVGCLGPTDGDGITGGTGRAHRRGDPVGQFTHRRRTPRAASSGLIAARACSACSRGSGWGRPRPPIPGAPPPGRRRTPPAARVGLRVVAIDQIPVSIRMVTGSGGTSRRRR